MSSEKRYYTANTNYFKHNVQLLHTIPSKLTFIADYEHQHVNINSTCLLCTRNTIAGLFYSESGTPFIASHLWHPAVYQGALQTINVLEVLTIQLASFFLAFMNSNTRENR